MIGVSRGMKKSLGYNILLLIILTVFLKCVGFINRIVIADYFGTNNLTDTYYIASGFIDGIAATLLAGLTVGVIKIYIYNRDANKNKYFISNLIVIVLMAMMAVELGVILLSSKISILLVHDPAGDEFHRVRKMLVLMSVTLPFQGIITVNSAVLQSEKFFTPVKLTGTVASATSILCVILFADKYGIMALVVSYLSGIVLNLFFLYFCTKNLW